MPLADSARAPSSLRTAHRALTRSRIGDAAGLLFCERGVQRTTMEDIAQAAGVSRSTVYGHYSDKDALLGWLAAEYGDALCQITDRLPGPRPSRTEIDAWIEELAAFMAGARASAVLISELAERDDAPQEIRAIGDRLTACLAGRLPGLACALQHPNSHDLAQAWTTVAMRELGWACLRFAKASDGAARATLIVAGDVFNGFIEAIDAMEVK